MSCIAATTSSHGADFVRATVMLASLEERNMTAYYECSTCGVVTKAREQICKPKELESKHSYCGTTPEQGEMCQEMKAILLTCAAVAAVQQNRRNCCATHC